MQITIVLRKEIADIAEAQTLLQAVKAKMADKPEIKINASISATIDTE